MCAIFCGNWQLLILVMPSLLSRGAALDNFGIDANTARLFVTRSGFLEEVAGPDDDPFGYRKRNMGGLNHKRYQRRIENKREAFAREAAAALEELVTHEGARRVILAGGCGGASSLASGLVPATRTAHP